MRKFRGLISSLCLAFGIWHLVIPAGAADPVEGLVEVLGGAQEVQLQLDILRGMTDALKGKRDVAMPAGWEKVEQKLGASENPQVKLLTQSLGLTFGSQRALAQLRAVVQDRTEDANTRRSALDSLLTARDAELPALLRELLHEVQQLRAQLSRSVVADVAADVPEDVRRT